MKSTSSAIPILHLEPPKLWRCGRAVQRVRLISVQVHYTLNNVNTLSTEISACGRSPHACVQFRSPFLGYFFWRGKRSNKKNTELYSRQTHFIIQNTRCNPNSSSRASEIGAVRVGSTPRAFNLGASTLLPQGRKHFKHRNFGMREGALRVGSISVSFSWLLLLEKQKK